MFSVAGLLAAPRLTWDVEIITSEIGKGLPAWQGMPGLHFAHGCQYKDLEKVAFT